MSGAKDGAAFSVFALPGLVKHITGRALSGVIADALGLPPATAHRLVQPERAPLLIGRLASSPFVQSDDALRTYISGEFPYPSLLSGILYPNIPDIWSDYERTFKAHASTMTWEAAASARYGCLPQEAILRLLHDLEVSAVPAECPMAAALSEVPLPDQLTRWMEKDRTQAVQWPFFELMALLDLDLCRSRFPGYAPRMIFPAVMPTLRKDAVRPYLDKPERRLLDLVYCLYFETSKVPPLAVMVGKYDEAREGSIRGKLGEGTFGWADFVGLLDLWGHASTLKAEAGPFSKQDVQRREAVPLILFIASRIFSYVFDVVQGREDKEVILEAFYHRYYHSWRRLVVEQGLDEAKGRPWDDQPLAKLLGNSYRVK